MHFVIQYTTYINSYMFRHSLLKHVVYVCHVCCITKCIYWIIF